MLSLLDQVLGLNSKTNTQRTVTWRTRRDAAMDYLIEMEMAKLKDGKYHAVAPFPELPVRISNGGLDKYIRVLLMDGYCRTYVSIHLLTKDGALHSER